MTDESKEVAARIGNFYLRKNNGDYAASQKEIEQLRISKVEVTVDGNCVIITTARPGLVIGRRGQNIDALTDALRMKVRIVEEADPLDSYLIPQPPEEMY